MRILVCALLAATALAGCTTPTPPEVDLVAQPPGKGALDRPSIVGTVAYGGPDTAQGMIDACEADLVPCVTNLLKSYLEAYGSKPAFEKLDEMTGLHTTISRESHPIAHDLGRHAYQAYGQVQRALKECSYEVFQGCFHGVLQSHFDALPVVDDDAIRDLCPDGTPFEEYACKHGVGHGLVLYSNYNVTGSLAQCDALDDSFGQGSCYGGVFMENMVAYMNNETGTTTSAAGHDSGHHHAPPVYMIDEMRPYYPCTDVEVRYKETCWLMQTSVILFWNKGDFKATSDLCRDAPKPYSNTCYRSMGRDASSYSNRLVKEGMTHCYHAQPPGRNMCVAGFVTDSILQYASPEKGMEICAAVPEDVKPACYYETGYQGKLMRGDAMNDLCATGEEPYVQDCKNGVKA